jgi:chaperone required for assembly of F1-ATPase
LRRFYREAAVQSVDGGFLVALDGRPLRTPGRAQLRLPTAGLAEAIAEEWRAQTDKIRPASMPLTQFANTAIDRVVPDRAPVIDELIAYGGTDLVCYRAEEPPSLVERQQRLWQPLLDWLAQSHDARLAVYQGVVPRPQPGAALDSLRRSVGALTGFHLTGLMAAAQASGSLVIALALAEGRITPDEAFDLAQLDESFQIERWGEDAEATARRRLLRQDIADIHRFLTLLAD